MAKGPHLCGPFGELPGIERTPEIALACRNTQVDDAKLRETTFGYAKGVDGINTMAGQHNPLLSQAMKATTGSTLLAPASSRLRAHARDRVVDRYVHLADHQHFVLGLGDQILVDELADERRSCR